MSSKPSPRTHAEARIAVQTYEPDPYDESAGAPALVMAGARHPIRDARIDGGVHAR